MASLRHLLAAASFVAAGALTSLLAAEWRTDYDQALKDARESGKVVMLNFTGSDWCGWCIRLDEEVFTKDEFEKYAAENLILVKLDFPRKKEQPAAEKERNRRLLEQFDVEGFPTLILLGPDGKKVGEMGYMRGGPTPFVAALDEHVAKARRPAATATAATN